MTSTSLFRNVNSFRHSYGSGRLYSLSYVGIIIFPTIAFTLSIKNLPVIIYFLLINHALSNGTDAPGNAPIISPAMIAVTRPAAAEAP